MNKSFTRTLGAAALLLGLSLPVLAKDKIVIGEQNWTGAIAIQNILGEVIKSRLDGDVSYLAGDVPVLFAAAAKGDGSVDVLTDIWLPNQSAAWAKYVTGGTRSLVPNKQPYLGVQGFYIPGYLQDKYGVKSVYDLQKPEVAKLFEPLGGGKAQLLVGPAGWESTYIGQIKAKDFGFADKFESVSTEASVTYAKLAAATRPSAAWCSTPTPRTGSSPPSTCAAWMNRHSTATPRTTRRATRCTRPMAAGNSSAPRWMPTG